MKAMILAAGRGERMRPLTDRLPKPLLAVAGKPLIYFHLEKLAQAGVTDVVINTAWLAEHLVAAIGTGAAWGLHVHWSHEPEGGLETAGGIIQALPWLTGATTSHAHLVEQQPFWVVNGDIWTDFDFNQLPRQLAGHLGHLVMVDNPSHHPEGDFSLTTTGLVTTAAKQVPRLTFSGVSVLSPALFAGYGQGRLALRPLFEQAISNQQLTGQHHQGCWTDVGTPERLARLNATLVAR